MSDAAVQNLDALLARKRELTSVELGSPAFQSRLKELRRWQANRLAHTYRDLHEDPRYAAALDFFLTALYSAEDFTARDADVVRALRYLKRALPEAPLHALARAIELEVLTAELDHNMVTTLSPGALNEDRYARAYRAVGKRAQREQQIDLVIRAGEDLDRAVHHALTGTLLKASHRAAHVAGFGVLQDFLEHGYRAFRRMGDAAPLLAAIRERETALMDALLSGAADPFAPSARSANA